MTRRRDGVAVGSAARLALALLVAGALVTVGACQSGGVSPGKAAEGAAGAGAGAVAGGGGVAGSRDGGATTVMLDGGAAVKPIAAAVTDVARSAPKGPPPKVKVSISSRPRATVTWGKKPLGMTPLTLERPQGSGPMDVVLRASGYFPVHSRLYTDKSDALSVKLTRHADRMSLFGARREPPPPPIGVPPGAVPPGGGPPAAPPVVGPPAAPPVGGAPATATPPAPPAGGAMAPSGKPGQQ